MADLGGTIVAEATPRGRGALRVVRISGQEAFFILDGLFKPSVEGVIPTGSPRRMVLGTVFDEGERSLDEALCVCFKAPASLTGEDVVELHLHGAPGVVRGVLDRIEELGGRRALPGEFSYRAVMNNKMSLLKAEAVQALVGAETTGQALRLAGGVANGGNTLLQEMREALLNLRAEWVAALDFPEEVQSNPVAGGLQRLEALKRGLEALVDDSRSMLRMQEGWSFAIVGPANSGKSSLFNALLRRERALVTPHPGTTRDTVEGRIEIEGCPLTLRDTAGVRKSNDPAERMGIETGLRAAKESNGALFVYDLAKGWGEEAENALASLGTSPVVFVANKADLCASQARVKDGAMVLSAKTGEGVEKLVDFLGKRMESEAPPSAGIIVSERQAACSAAALDGCRRALKALRSGFTEEVALGGLNEAQRALDELLGGGSPEDLYDRIFSTFCIGK